MLQAQNLGIFSQNLPEAANHSCPPPNMSEGRTPSHGLKSCHRLSPMAQVHRKAFSKDFCKNGWRFHMHIHSNHCIDVHWGFQFVPKVQFGDHISSVLALVWQGWKLKVSSDGPLSYGVVSFCSMAEAAKGPKATMARWIIAEVNRQSEPAYCCFGNVLVGDYSDYRSNRTWSAMLSRKLDH